MYGDNITITPVKNGWIVTLPYSDEEQQKATKLSPFRGGDMEPNFAYAGPEPNTHIFFEFSEVLEFLKKEIKSPLRKT